MAHSLSAKKRMRQNEKRRQRNTARKSAMRTQIKKFNRFIEVGDVAGAEKALPECMSLLDRAAKSGAIHTSNADRHKARLSKALEKARKAKA